MGMARAGVNRSVITRNMGSSNVFMARLTDLRLRVFSAWNVRYESGTHDGRGRAAAAGRPRQQESRVRTTRATGKRVDGESEAACGSAIESEGTDKARSTVFFAVPLLSSSASSPSLEIALGWLGIQAASRSHCKSL